MMNFNKTILAFSFISILIFNTYPSNANGPKNRITFDQLVKETDLFCNGLVTDQKIELDNFVKRQRIIYMIKISKIYFNRLLNIELEDYFEITAPLMAGDSPKLKIGQSYLFFLKFSQEESSFKFVLGGEGVLEIDHESGDLLNIYGFYIEEIKNNKLVVGPQHPKYHQTEEKQKQLPIAYSLDESRNIKKIIYPSVPLKYRSPSKKIGLDTFVNKAIETFEYGDN